MQVVVNSVSSIVSIKDDRFDLIINFILFHFKINFRRSFATIELIRSLIVLKLKENLFFLFNLRLRAHKLFEGRKRKSVFITRAELIFSFLCLPHPLEDTLTELGFLALGFFFLKSLSSSKLVSVA